MENYYNDNSKNYKAHSVKEKGIMANCITLNQTSYHGAGAIQSIPDEVKAHGLTKAFVCSDPDLIKFGVTKKVTDVLEAAELEYEIYSNIKPNPTIENVQTGVAAFKESGADYFIAIGGGSSMDTAKAIGVIINNPDFEDVRSLEGVAPTTKPTVPIIAVPTTAGTAAEVTINYVIKDDEKQRKFVCVDPKDIPVVAIVDPDMMSSMPYGLTASTGMDALTHAIEGYITKGAWEMTDMFHIKAIEVISRSLRAACENDPKGREDMALGQYIAGMGFSNVGLGIVHSMAHALGAVYDTPHGVANAILLPTVMAYNADATGTKYKDIAIAMGVEGVEDMTQEEYRKAAVDAVAQLSKDVKIPQDLKEIVKEEDLDFLVDSAYNDACAPGNPKDASKEDIKALQDKIDEASALNESDYTKDSWDKMISELEESKELLAQENPLQSAVKEQTLHMTAAIEALVKADKYVLMNIPYAEFYKAETTGNDTKVDAFTSATKNKTRTKGLAGGSYHENADGSSIDGITYAVKVDPSVDLSKYKEVKDDDSVEITVTNRGQTTTTTLTGKDTLFENASYAYYPLTEAPANYKEVSVDADGKLVFSEVKGQEATKVEGVTAKLSTESSYGDYELDLDGLPEEITSDNVNAVVVKTTDGTAYGMRHLENIWLGTKLAWSTGFTSQVHGCPTSSGHYKSMMGKTIDSIEYYTTNGVYTMDIADIYVPVKSEITKVKVADADITAGKTKINVQLPDEFKPEYSVDGLDVSVEGKVLTFKAATESRAAASVKPGKYTLTIKDKNKKYADVVTTFTLTTKDMPAAYDEENKKLLEAKGFDTDALKAYLGNITSVNVNGKDYAASGRGSVVIINKDGTIKTDADPFKDAVAGTEFQITVASTGYTTPLTFTYKIAETPAPAEVDTTALEAAIAEADNLKEADYTAESWSVYQAALQSARTALEAKESQDAVDQALAALNAAKDALVKAEEEPVAINTASLEKAIADAKALKEADYTADSWKALQSALSDAQKALEAKESQEAVDNATNSLNKAIKALVKKGSSSVKKTDGTTNGSKTSGNDSVKTGDPASVLGWLGLAVSSLGAGMGGFAWKRRKRK